MRRRASAHGRRANVDEGSEFSGNNRLDVALEIVMILRLAPEPGERLPGREQAASRGAGPKRVKIGRGDSVDRRLWFRNHKAPRQAIMQVGFGPMGWQRQRSIDDNKSAARMCTWNGFVPAE